MEEGDYYCSIIDRKEESERLFPIIRLSNWKNKEIKYFPTATTGNNNNQVKFIKLM